jgi:hypothetical protein
MSARSTGQRATLFLTYGRLQIGETIERWVQ